MHVLRKTLITNALRRFIRSEDGGMIIWGLFLFLSMAILSGLAIDIARLQTATVQMQNAADSAAHAALITRRTSSASIATERAIAIAQGHMPPSRYGTVLASADVQFGTWDSSKRVFTPSANATNAVRVTIRQTKASANPFYTSLLRLVGITNWDAVRTAVYQNRVSSCQRQGIISQGVMSFDSLNTFYAPLCMHSNTMYHISVGNTYHAGVGVSVPAPNNFRGDPNKNIGFSEAKSFRTLDVMSMTSPIPSIINGLRTPGSPFIPSYITNQNVQPITSKSSDQWEVKAGQLTSGRIYGATCNPNGTTDPQFIVIKPALTAILSNLVIVTNCKVRLEAGVRLENAVIATSNTSSPAITAGALVVIGKDDHCASGGGAQLVTTGGIALNSMASIYGGQLLAVKDIKINAKTNGMMGLSIATGGMFMNTSEATWGACPETSVENTYQSLSAASLVH